MVLRDVECVGLPRGSIGRLLALRLLLSPHNTAIVVQHHYALFDAFSRFLVLHTFIFFLFTGITIQGLTQNRDV